MHPPTARRLFIGVLATLITLACAGRSLAAYPVKTVDSIVLFDAQRQREIPIKIYYPAGQRGVPLIVFSHGFGGDKDGYVYLGAGWASKGYAVILPTHKGGDREALAARGFGSVVRGEAVVTTAQLADNARDISFIISSLPEIAHRSPEFAGVINANRIGVAGHSMGAGTALVLDGAMLPGFIAISPQGMSSGADEHRWDTIERPTMDIYGSNDAGVQGEPPGWRHQPFDHMPPGDKYNLVVDGANHFSFADAPKSPGAAVLLGRGQTRDINAIHDYVVQASLVFWDAYLRGDATAKTQLRAGRLSTSGSLRTLTRK